MFAAMHRSADCTINFSSVWKQAIRSIRRILCTLLKEQILTDDTLSTLFAKVEFIINSRLLTPVVLNPAGEEPLTPNYLLLLRLPADHFIEIFTSDYNYVCKRWRQLQYLAEQFSIRWKREYLQTCKPRSRDKSHSPTLTSETLFFFMMILCQVANRV